MIDFLTRGDKVRLLLAFRGRELAHPEIGEQVMNRMLKTVEEIANLDSPPKRMGKSIAAVLSVKAQYRKEKVKPEKSSENGGE